MSNIVQLHRSAPVAQFIRIGHSDRAFLEQMASADRLTSNRFVIEAGLARNQETLLDALRAKGCELILDPNIAELSTIGRFDGAAKNAPWANSDRPLSEVDFNRRNDSSIANMLSEFAVEKAFDRVLSPTHFLSDSNDRWLDIDLIQTELLRTSLDASGGKGIALDYHLTISANIFFDDAKRRQLIAKLRSVPINALWLRISGFGADAAPLAIKRYISAAQEFHSLEVPIICDCIGGLAMLTTASFGAVSGVTFGVAGKQRFDGSAWHKPRIPGGGGNNYSILLPGIDRLLKPDQAEKLVSSAGGTRLLACNDRNCCPHGFSDTRKDYRGHFLRQRARECQAISDLSESVRPTHFVNSTITQARRTASSAARLRIGDDKLIKALGANLRRIERLEEILVPMLDNTEGLSKARYYRESGAFTEKANRKRK